MFSTGCLRFVSGQTRLTRSTPESTRVNSRLAVVKTVWFRVEFGQQVSGTTRLNSVKDGSNPVNTISFGSGSGRLGWTESTRSSLVNSASQPGWLGQLSDSVDSFDIST
ncbi:hypothetical protein Hanom_Chr14g01259911 [Helianthus anomalus]